MRRAQIIIVENVRQDQVVEVAAMGWNQHHVALACRRPEALGILGRELDAAVQPGSHEVVASLSTGTGQSIIQQRQDLAGQRVVVLDTSSIPPGRYQLQLSITDAKGRLCSEETRDVEAVPGPDYDAR